MSKALVKKSLDLLTLEVDGHKDKRKQKKPKSSNTLDLLPVNHRLISKHKKNGPSNVLKRSHKITVAEVKKQLRSRNDPTEENVKRLLLLSGNRLDYETSEKILTRAVEKHYITEKEKPVEEEKTAFTEEDFQKFEAEYFDE